MTIEGFFVRPSPLIGWKTQLRANECFVLRSDGIFPERSGLPEPAAVDFPEANLSEDASLPGMREIANPATSYLIVTFVTADGIFRFQTDNKLKLVYS